MIVNHEVKMKLGREVSLCYLGAKNLVENPKFFLESNSMQGAHER